MKRQSKKRVAPKTNPKGPVVPADKTPTQREVDKNNGKMAMQKHSDSRIGRDPDFVETVGLGNLRVISANGIKWWQKLHTILQM